MSLQDKQLIEDYLPIQAISAEASREKSLRKGHISTLHLWWARRPLVACRAAVYGALVPLARFRPSSGPEEKRDSLGRANAAKFVERLCKFPGDPTVIAEAEKHILDAHSHRLAEESSTPVTSNDILKGRAPRPKVLDMFAGGGAIPLEALRLGCEAFALDLNPVAHIIQLCTLVHPQAFGRPDLTTKGCGANTTWAGLSAEVRHWGDWVLKMVSAEIGDLYPSVSDPEAPPTRIDAKEFLPGMDPGDALAIPSGYLTPVAYLWTRTVPCKNPACKATVPLVRQTWLCRKRSRYVALRTIAPKKEKRVRFEVVEAQSESAIGFKPELGSSDGNATCPFCGSVADNDYVQAEGCAGRRGEQLMAVVCTRPGMKGKVYLTANALPESAVSARALTARIESLCRKAELTVPGEPINPIRPSPNARGLSGVTRHGIRTFGDLFTSRQLLTLLTFAAVVKRACAEMRTKGYDDDRLRAVGCYLAILCDRVASSGSSFSRWNNAGEKIESLFSRQALPMVWDFAEASPFGGASGGADNALDWIVGVIDATANTGIPAIVSRGTACALPWSNSTFDAIITDPPYYDNVPYADVSDFFYVWLKRTLGPLYPEHFAAEAAPKKAEATALASRHNGNMEAARREYEDLMAQSFREAHRVLKQGAPMVVVYAHKTTLGWSTLVDALRRAGFMVTEAWPLDTEMKSRLVAMDTASLASSISIVARKRESRDRGRYETEVRPELERIVRDRVDVFWDIGISGADLVIACVGAGLRAFTCFDGVEYENGDEVPAEQFLKEVETVVLESILTKLSKAVGANGGKHGLTGLDPATRFYILWRYTYRSGELDAGEAIIFANGTHVELDGAHGLSSGPRPLVEKRKARYLLFDYTERGKDPKLGLPEGDRPAAVVDVLHRTLWLMEHKPAKLPEFLNEAQAHIEQLRLLAQALAGPALKGGDMGGVSPSAELSALTKLTANWRSVIDGATLPLFSSKGDSK